MTKKHYYKGETIERHPITGYWTCLCFAFGGYLKADTLRGMKRLISDYK